MAAFANDDGTWLTLGLLGVISAVGLVKKRSGSRYRTQDELFSVQSTSGKTYNLRVVPPGGSYGLNHALTNNGPAMLEFYWPNDTIGEAPWGQFTGERYRLTTLVKSDGGRPKGLAMQTDREGQFSADTMNRAIVWALGGNPDSYYG